MNRPEFIKLVKADLRSQSLQVVALMVTIALFGGLGTMFARRWEDEVLKPDSPQLWFLLGLAVAFAISAVAVLRLGNRFLLKCPHCQKCLGGVSSQVVVACGRCGFCGERIIDGEL